MVSEPTQTADEQVENRWEAHPGWARLVRVTIVLLPVAFAVGFSFAAAEFFPPTKVGLGRWTWVGLVFGLSTLVLYVTGRMSRRLMPLAALLQLSLVFPDKAPSRARSALRETNTRKVLRELEDARLRGETSQEVLSSEFLMDLLTVLNEHDRLTRGHSERVRAYSDLIAIEMGLPKEDQDKLRWAALLHDVGKITVPAEILNKPGRPTEEEWEILKGHPQAGGDMLAPLIPWLGDWVKAASQHHLRWDGKGYPESLSGTDISLAGRIVAVADAYDVMTSARSYKKPLSAVVARREVTDCAGSQFDPAVVRAFLAIGIGRLNTVVGPLGWIGSAANLMQVPFATTTVTTSVSTAVAASAMMAGTIAAAPVEEAPPEELAFVEQIAVSDVTIVGAEDEGFEITLEATGGEGEVTFRVGGPAHGSLVLAKTQTVETELLETPVFETATGWAARVGYQPDPDYFGEDGFAFQACDSNNDCATGQVSLVIEPVNDAPVAQVDQLELIAGQTVRFDPIGNDTDVEGEPLTLVEVSQPGNGVVSVADGEIIYTSAPDFVGTDAITYVVEDSSGARTEQTVEIVVLAAPAPTPQPTTTPAPTPTPSPLPTATPAPTSTPPPTPTSTPLPTATPVINIVVPTSTPVPATATPIPTATSTPQPTSTPLPTATATPTPTATPVPNGAPNAVVDNITRNEDGATVLIDVLGNDTDPDGDPLAITGVGPAISGTVVFDENAQTIAYTPPTTPAGGSDSFSYTISDGVNPDVLGFVQLTIVAVDDPPVLSPITRTIPEDEAVGTTPLFVVPFVDEDEKGTNVFAIDAPNPSPFFSVTNDGEILLTQALDYETTTQHVLTVSAHNGGPVSTTTVTINVGPVNEPPVVQATSATLTEGDSSRSVALQVSDPEGDAVNITLTNSPVLNQSAAGGTLVVSGTQVIYSPPSANFSGADSFTYQADDGDPGLSPVPGSVTITVDPVNDPPTVSSHPHQNMVAGEAYSLEISATDVEGDNLSFNVDPGTPLPSGLSLTPGASPGLATIGGTLQAGTEGQTWNVDIIVTDDGSPAPKSSTISLTMSSHQFIMSPLAGDLVISEVLFHQSGYANPFPNLPVDEFVEFWNVSSDPISLDGMRVVDYNLRQGSADALSMDASLTASTPVVLAPGERAVLWMFRPGSLTNNVTVPAGANLWLDPAPTFPLLDNQGDEIWLLDDQNRIIDFVRWGDPADPSAAISDDPPAEWGLWDDTDQVDLMNVPPGQSIALPDNVFGTNSASCWEHSASGDAATNGCLGAGGAAPTVTPDTDTDTDRISSANN